MSDYWKSYYAAWVHAHPDDLCKQVGKTVNGQSLDIELLQVMADNVAKLLKLGADDAVLDLCCGNGLITQRVAPYVRSVLGVDYSDALIAVANAGNTANNIRYMVGDATQLESQRLYDMGKCYMHEALAHFTPETLRVVLASLRSCGVTHVLFVGITDHERIWEYYDTDAKRAYYWQCEQAQRPHMGRWWYKAELQELASEQGYRAQFFNEPPQLPTAYYRFNCLLNLPASSV